MQQQLHADQFLCRNATTFARLADGLGFVHKDDIFHVMKAIVAAQRDYGRRDDRKQARLKYLVEEWGIDKFRTVVEQYFGKKIEPLRSEFSSCTLSFSVDLGIHLSCILSRDAGLVDPRLCRPAL